MSQPSRLEELPAAPSQATGDVILEDKRAGVGIEFLIQSGCYLLRSLLGADKHAVLFQSIQERDRPPLDTLPRVMVPAPKTLVFGENQSSLQFKLGEVGDMVEEANKRMK
jgi:hypothetical protein